MLLVLLAACSGVQAPEHALPAASTQPATTAAAETAAPPSADTPAPTPTATLAPPDDTPNPYGPTPTPNLGDMTVRLLTSTSPDGEWKAEALLADPYNPQGTFVGDMDHARLTVLSTDGSQSWVPYEEWSPTGLGDSYINGSCCFMTWKAGRGALSTMNGRRGSSWPFPSPTTSAAPERCRPRSR